jgi:UV DNA damage repair endonuclease
MFNQDIQRIGFCCKYLSSDQTQPKKLLEDTQRPFNTRSTTIAWLNRQDKDVAEQRLWDLMVHNIQSYYNLIEYTGGLIPQRRMVRLGSDCLPAFTEKDWSYFWQKPDVQAYCEKEFAKVGELARQLDVKLSFHPGQFCVLASDNPDIVKRSVEEFEYHVDMARWMGYGKQFQDFKCNVHISGRQGYQGIINVLPSLTPEARNIITIENDEMCHGLDASLMLKDHVALVLDIHHHWIRDEEYIQANDDRVKMVIDSWRGVRPTLHYSYSRDEWLPEGYTHDNMHDINILLEDGSKKQKLRAHSDFYPNYKVNEWALSFWDNFDIQCEAKAKNLASEQLYNQAKETLNMCR